MLYTIINPSDPYTFRAPDHELAAIVGLILGQGAYGIECVDDDTTACGIYLFGGADEGFQERFGRTIETAIEARKGEIPKAMRSVWIGPASDRLGIEAAVKACDSEKTRRALLDTRHDAARSSLNDIGTRAARFAVDIASRCESDGVKVTA